VLPDILTVAEFVPGYEFSFWTGIGAPKNTPAAISTSSTPRSMRLSPIPR
jgi:tripartite-type tricarboxylate transporter receptor subunit TctC